MGVTRGERLLQRYNRRLHIWYAKNMGQRPVVKVYGLLRTGTNYMTRLLELNFDVFCLASTEEGWKHGACEYNEQFYYVFLVKNPYSWIVSFREWEQIHGRTDASSLTEFISSAVTQQQLNDAWKLENPVTAWSESLRSWSQYQGRSNVIFVRYEDLLDSFDNQLKQIGNAFGFKPLGERFRNLETRADNWSTPKPRRKLSPDFYRNKEYLKLFTKNDLEIMSKFLNQEMVESFGYNVL